MGVKPQIRQGLGVLCVAAAVFIASFAVVGMSPDLAVLLRYAAGIVVVVCLAVIGVEMTRD